MVVRYMDSLRKKQKVRKKGRKEALNLFTLDSRVKGSPSNHWTAKSI